MNDALLNNILNRLLTLHTRSLPMYLRYASPYAVRGREHEIELTGQIAADQQAFAERFADLILEIGEIDDGEFPMVFTGYNDLSFDYLVQRMIAHQESDIRTIEACIAQLTDAPRARALAEEALGAAKGHLDSLRELQVRVVSG